ncbi:hypothetical protein PMAYCL1PPCAC_04521, partial [Pristionchus mayeri]
TMRGAVVTSFGEPDVIKTSNDLPLPATTQPDQILIDVHAAGVNPVDTHIRAGRFNPKPALPYVPGIDGSGVVREVGAAVTHVRVGDSVWFYVWTGATAEVVATAHAYPLPKGLSFVEGACLGLPYSIANRALFTKGNIKKGDRVLIHGASGGVGLAACQLAAFAGASLVVGTAGTEPGLAEVKRYTVASVIGSYDWKSKSGQKKVPDSGFDLIIEMAADSNIVVDLDLLAHGGRLGIIGGKGAVTIPLATFKDKETTSFGVVAYRATKEYHAACAKTLDRLFAETEYRPVCNKTYKLEDTAQSHIDLWDKSLPKVGNRVIIVKE